MAIEKRFYMNTAASRQELRDALARAQIGLEALPDFEHVSEAASQATIVSIIQYDDPARRGRHYIRPDNGVIATHSLCFRLRRRNLPSDDDYNRELVLGVVALLKAFPEADAYLLLLDAEIPALLYKDGQLVLAEQLTRDSEMWDAERQPYRGLVDLPYTIAPLGPWPYIDIDSGGS